MSSAPDQDDAAFVAQHTHVFNTAVRTGDWTRFVEQFDEAGVVVFVGPPVGPFEGRDEIAAAYAASPPDDTIELRGQTERNGDELVVAYAWSTSGETGTMRFVRTAGRLARMTITFD